MSRGGTVGGSRTLLSLCKVAVEDVDSNSHADCRIGHIERKPSDEWIRRLTDVEIEEIHDALRSENPVDQVTYVTGEDRHETIRAESGRSFLQRPSDKKGKDHHRDQGNHREDGLAVAKESKGRAGIVVADKGEQSRNDFDRPAKSENPDDELFADLVQDKNSYSRKHQAKESRTVHFHGHLCENAR
jgi:hypothetical protein